MPPSSRGNAGLLAAKGDAVLITFFGDWWHLANFASRRLYWWQLRRCG